MILYHYTTLQHYLEIVVAGQINTTHSELLRPVNIHLNGEGTAWVDEATDNYKPVVWLTSHPNASSEDYGSSDTTMISKTEARIAIKRRHGMFLWSAWAKQNHIETSWFESLKNSMPDWKNVYVCEKPIPTSDFLSVDVSTAALVRDGLSDIAIKQISR